MGVFCKSAALKGIYRSTALTVVAPFFLMTIVSFFPVRAFADSQLLLPPIGAFIKPSQGFNPAVLKGLRVNQDNPLMFDFFIDSGDSGLNNDAMRDEASRLIKYFMATLTVPENDLWVNLSPYEKERIIPNELGITDMGRELLAQDYLLKQITASFIHPEEKVGKEFWTKVREKTLQLYGKEDVAVNTFNKVWIVPDKAVITQYQNIAFVTECSLKVMLEADYLAMKNGMEEKNFKEETLNQQSAKDVNDVSSSIVRQVVLPALQDEVNQGKNFAPLRQVFYSMILATWYKKNLKNSVMGRVYMDQKKVAGIDLADRDTKEKIYKQYVEAFKKGVYSMVREEYDAGLQDYVPRKYFSGGVTATRIDAASSTIIAPDVKTLVASAPVKGGIIEVNANFNPSPGPGEQGRSSTPLQDQQERAQIFRDLLKKVVVSQNISKIAQGMIPEIAAEKSLDELVEILKGKLREVKDVIGGKSLFQWYFDGQKNAGYHDLEHSLRVAILSLKYAHGNNFSESWQALYFIAGLLHDFDSTRADGTEASVVRTIKWIGEDSLDNNSKLREIFGLGDFEIAVLKILILRTQTPFDGKIALESEAPFYRDTEGIPRAHLVQELDRFRKSDVLKDKIGRQDVPAQEIFIASLVDEAANLSMLDMMNGYLIDDFKLSLEMVVGLASEYSKRSNEQLQISPGELLAGTAFFLINLAGGNFGADNKIIVALGLEKYFDQARFLPDNMSKPRDVVFKILKQEGEEFNKQVKRWEWVKEYVAQQDAQTYKLKFGAPGSPWSEVPWIEEEIKRINDFISEKEIQAKRQEDQNSAAAASLSAGDNNVGGINLSADMLNLQTRGESIKFDFNMSPAMIETLPIEGFTPLIFQITPVTNLPLLLSGPQTKPLSATL